MVFNGSPNKTVFKLNGVQLDIVESYKYLGITLTSKYVTNLFRQHFTSIIDRAKTKAAIIRRHGFHEDGLRFKTVIKQCKLVIRPVLEYGAQALTYNRYSQPAQLGAPCGFAKELDNLQTQILKIEKSHKKFQNCIPGYFVALNRLPACLRY